MALEFGRADCVTTDPCTVGNSSGSKSFSRCLPPDLPTHYSALFSVRYKPATVAVFCRYTR